MGIYSQGEEWRGHLVGFLLKAGQPELSETGEMSGDEELDQVSRWSDIKDGISWLNWLNMDAKTKLYKDEDKGPKVTEEPSPGLVKERIFITDTFLSTLHALIHLASTTIP